GPAGADREGPQRLPVGRRGGGMNGPNYVILAYAIGLGLLWGYAARLWWQTRSLARRQRAANPGGQS
ncbi:MAG TPA: hypothetical protein VNL70_09850, partial [Tepidisphaeraceae bacterium]|nr:hypothetical protein [Tepidisphaeraceae bacterium]